MSVFELGDRTHELGHKATKALCNYILTQITKNNTIYHIQIKKFYKITKQTEH